MLQNIAFSLEHCYQNKKKPLKCIPAAEIYYKSLYGHP